MNDAYVGIRILEITSDGIFEGQNNYVVDLETMLENDGAT